MAAKSKTRKNKLFKKRLFESSSDESSSDELPLKSESEIEIEDNENCVNVKNLGKIKKNGSAVCLAKNRPHFVCTGLENVKKRYISHFYKP
jgi:hypothetical protein